MELIYQWQKFWFDVLAYRGTKELVKKEIDGDLIPSIVPLERIRNEKSS